MFGKFKTAHLLGITRGNMHRFRLVEEKLTKMGYIVFAPVIYQYDVYLQIPELLDDMCCQLPLPTEEGACNYPVV